MSIEVKKLKKMNVRDLGGAYNNVFLRKHMIYRGRAPIKMNKSQRDCFYNELKIKTVIDLRSIIEIEQDPIKLRSDVNYLSLPIYKDSLPGITHEQIKSTPMNELYKIVPSMETLYYETFHNEPLENIAKIMKTIIDLPEDSYPIYVNCAEGKDRAGAIASCILLVLGIEDEEIIQDYLYTNKTAKGRAYRYYLFAKYLKFDKKLADKLKAVYVAKREYFEAVVKIVNEEYGGRDNFIKNGLKLSKKDVEIFKQRMKA